MTRRHPFTLPEETQQTTVGSFVQIPSTEAGAVSPVKRLITVTLIKQAGAELCQAHGKLKLV